MKFSEECAHLSLLVFLRYQGHQDDPPVLDHLSHLRRRKRNLQDTFTIKCFSTKRDTDRERNRETFEGAPACKPRCTYVAI